MLFSQKTLQPLFLIRVPGSHLLLQALNLKAVPLIHAPLWLQVLLSLFPAWPTRRRCVDEGDVRFEACVPNSAACWEHL